MPRRNFDPSDSFRHLLLRLRRSIPGDVSSCYRRDAGQSCPGGTSANRVSARIHPGWATSVFPVLAVTAAFVWLSPGFTADASAQPGFTPADPPNQPMGVGRGIHPGRVAWVEAPSATSWDGVTGDWWEDANTDPAAVDGMLLRALESLTGEETGKQGWTALFRHFNRERQRGDRGYRDGEKIAIKINMNQDRPGGWSAGQGMPSPQIVYSLVHQLIKVVGVRGKEITIYDASRYIGDPIYQKIRNNRDPEFQAVRFVVSPSSASNGRLEATWDRDNPVHFAQSDLPTAYLPRCVTEADYLINAALLRPHTMFGVTLTAKNHFGSVYFPDNGGWTPAPLHGAGARRRPMASYNCLVDLIGHRHLGGKTLLYLVDGLYPAEHQQGRVIRFLSFGDRWAASLLASQDPIAIDSVGLDILRNEPRATQVRENPDNYLHEGALAGKPPSGVVYDPESDGTPLTSLGVHEHWNNASDKRYSRNLGRRTGIELVHVTMGGTASISPTGSPALLKPARQ